MANEIEILLEVSVSCVCYFVAVSILYQFLHFALIVNSVAFSCRLAYCRLRFAVDGTTRIWHHFVSLLSFWIDNCALQRVMPLDSAFWFHRCNLFSVLRIVFPFCLNTILYIN